MAIKRINESPSISDTILFDITTPGDDECLSDPYKIDQVTIYFVERNFALGNSQEYRKTVNSATDEDAVAAALRKSCDLAKTADAAAMAYSLNPNPTTQAAAEEAAAAANQARDDYHIIRSNLSASAQVISTHFSQASPVMVLGNPDFPAWLSTDVDDSRLTHAKEILGEGLDGLPIEGAAIPGHFLFEWRPDGGAREGDYFICWKWTPNPAGLSLSAHIPFSLRGNTQITTSIPTHFTTPGKYETLLDRYLPEMFKMYISREDVTPEVLAKFHGAIAAGFTAVEDLANQLIDILDANATHEALIPYLSNLFGLKLRSGDPTLWRRQTKQAIPNFKKKGTESGLKDALSQAGMQMTKLTTLMQVVSRYTWVDGFIVEDDQTSFTLSRPMILPVDLDNFQLAIRPVGESDYTILDDSYVSFDEDDDGFAVMTWEGDSHNSLPISLVEGDLIRVMYSIATVPNLEQQFYENYLRSLPLADQRDEVIVDDDGKSTLKYPLKNWNIRVIEEDDVFFPHLCSCVDQYNQDVIFGYVRTEFPYSENIYNMDEYNGSTRPSKEPCDIGREFIDECSCCRSSKFTIDVEIDELSNDKIVEAQEIIDEFTPMSSVLHMVNFSGSISDFSMSPQEDLEMLIQYKFAEGVIAGNANNAFTRFRGGNGDQTMPVPDGDDPSDPAYLTDVYRNMLANSTEIRTLTTGIAYNSKIVLSCANVRFDRIGLSPDNLIEVLSPSPNVGNYQGILFEQNSVEIPSGVVEPINQTEFTFRVSNRIYTNPATTVSQDDYFLFRSPGEEWEFLTSVSGWTLEIDVIGQFNIAKLLPGGILEIEDPTRILPVVNTANLDFKILNGIEVIYEGDQGILSVSRRGRIVMPDVQIPDIRLVADIGDFVEIFGVQYRLIGFVNGIDDAAYIEGYTGGDAAGMSATVYRRLVDNQIGHFSYRGVMLQTLDVNEGSLFIQNGANATGLDVVESTLPGNPSFKENFLVIIDNDYYVIEDINHNMMILGGPMKDFGTLSYGGENVSFSLLQFSNVTTNLSGIGDTLNIDGKQFEFIDRRGNDMVDKEIIENASIPIASLASAMNSSEGEAVKDMVSSDESISFTIEYKDGETDNGVL